MPSGAPREEVTGQGSAPATCPFPAIKNPCRINSSRECGCHIPVEQVAPAGAWHVYLQRSEWEKPDPQPRSREADLHLPDMHAPTVSPWLTSVTESQAMSNPQAEEMGLSHVLEYLLAPRKAWVERATARPVFEEAELPGWWTRHDLSSVATRRTSRALCPHRPDAGIRGWSPLWSVFLFILGVLQGEVRRGSWRACTEQ